MTVYGVIVPLSDPPKQTLLFVATMSGDHTTPLDRQQFCLDECQTARSYVEWNTRPCTLDRRVFLPLTDTSPDVFGC